jgi:hypothetical protein
MNALRYLGGIVAAAVIGWLAAQLQSRGFAPLVLMPLATGLVLGLTLRKLAGALAIGRRQALWGALLFAIVSVLTEHTWLYQDFRRQWQAEREANPQVAMFRPAEPLSMAEYFRREASSMRVALWCLDAALVVASTVMVVTFHREKVVVADDANRPLTSDL